MGESWTVIRMLLFMAFFSVDFNAPGRASAFPDFFVTILADLHFLPGFEACSDEMVDFFVTHLAFHILFSFLLFTVLYCNLRAMRECFNFEMSGLDRKMCKKP